MWTQIKGWLGLAWVVAGRVVSRAPVYAVVAIVLGWTKAKYPNVYLPSADTITDIVLAALTVHSTADAYGLVRAYLEDLAAQNRRLLPLKPAK